MKTEERKSRLETLKESPGENFSLGPKRLVVSLAKIMEDPKNERKVFRNMEGFISSIQAVGVVEPLTVTQEENGLFRILTGHRRFRGAKEAGLETVEVIIRDPEDEKTRRFKSIVSNVQRESVGPVEMADALQELLVDYQISQRELSGVIGKAETWVSRMLRILDIPDELKTKLATSEISLSYDAVAEIARLEDVKIQDNLVSELLEGATLRDIRQRIKEVKGTLPKTKPKKVFNTNHNASVIVQSKTSRLSKDQTISALEEALKTARTEK